MLIPVIYLNGKQDMVKEYLLSELIEQQQIVRFKRSAGWVDLAMGDVRTQPDLEYIGPERRGVQFVEMTG